MSKTHHNVQVLDGIVTKELANILRLQGDAENTYRNEILNKSADEIERLREENNLYREALEFYAQLERLQKDAGGKCFYCGKPCIKDDLSSSDRGLWPVELCNDKSKPGVTVVMHEKCVVARLFGIERLLEENERYLVALDTIYRSSLSRSIRSICTDAVIGDGAIKETVKP